MKKLLIAAACCAFAVPALAGDVTITVPDSFPVTMQNAGLTLERCIANVTMRVDPGQTCLALRNLLTEMSTLKTTPVPVATPAPSPSVTPTPQASAAPLEPAPLPKPAPEAQKKTSDGTDRPQGAPPAQHSD